MANKKTEFETFKNVISEIPSLKRDQPSCINFFSYKKTKVTIEEIEESNEVYIQRLTEMLENADGYTNRSRIKDEISRLQKQIPNVSSMEPFIQFIKNMDVNKTYDIVAPFYYETIRIDKNSETEFSWSLRYSYKVAGRTGYLFPLTTGDMVKQFKTEAGAKRSLIKQCEFLFKNNEQAGN